jgi:hypothetical protein
MAEVFIDCASNFADTATRRQYAFARRRRQGAPLEFGQS